MAGQASIENGKKGGRPPGSLNQSTIEKKEAEKQFTDRVVKSVDRLFNAQISIAEGCSYLFRVDETGEGNKKRKEHVLVTDPDEIQRFLDGDADDNYYYITTRTPDNKAIDSLMDRAFGKATNKTELTGKDGERLVSPIYGGLSKHDSDQKDIQPQEENQSG